MSCEDGHHTYDISEEETVINLTELQAQMHTFHTERDDEFSLSDALEKRIKTVHDLIRYLSFVPIGRSGPREPINSKAREAIFHDRGCVCEICQSKLDAKSFQLHHMNYFKGNDPEYLKVVCEPCHSVVNMLTGVVSWFESKMHPLDGKSAPFVTNTDKEDITDKVPAYLRLFGRHQSFPQDINQRTVE